MTIRESRRARRLSLRSVPPHVLEVVVPVGTPPAAVQAFIRDHSAWIAERQARVEAEWVANRDELPPRIVLCAADVVCEVRYRQVAGTRARGRLHEGVLEVSMPRAALPEVAQRILRVWLLDMARVHLEPWLLHEAQRLDKHPAAVRMRLQRTRWGSCSTRRNINLNASALFLPPDVVRYLMVHELCHLDAPNHSRRFWRLVERYEPDWRELDRQLAAGWKDVPLWVMNR